jgi:hypothetical protein
MVMEGASQPMITTSDEPLLGEEKLFLLTE